MTDDLRWRLQKIGHDPYQYLQEFSSWQSLGGGEDDHFWFGKDGAYDKPRSSHNERVLRHVHLTPEEGSPRG